MYLFHPQTDRIVAAAKRIKPHSTRRIAVRLSRGEHLQWGCYLAGRPSRVSDVETVPLEHVYGGHGKPIVPLSRDELVPAMKAYRAYVVRELGLLTTQTSTLMADLGSDDVDAAESEWLVAHQTWLRIGQDDGAYSAFGALGRKIDGTTAGLNGGTSSPQFTGFHRIEWDLWTDQDVSAAAADSQVLVKDVGRLTGRPIAKWLPYDLAGVSGLPLRCHEILEDALRDSLSGEDDYGSGTSLASVHADVAGTREFLTLLGSLLKPRAPHLDTHARAALSRLDRTLDATKSDGSWVAVTDLPRRQREAVDSATGHALNVLAPIPDLLTIGKS